MSAPTTDPTTLSGAGRSSRALRMAARRRTQGGVALFMVTSAIVVLTIMLAEFQEETSSEVAAATAARDAVEAEFHARSAINLSRLLIASEPTIRNAILPLFMMLKRKPPQLPVWEFTDRFLGAFNGKEESADFSSTFKTPDGEGKNLGLEKGHFEISVVDEDSKINVNLGAANEIAHIRLARQLMGTMVGAQYNPLFEARDPSGSIHDRLTICQAMIDWADNDENGYSCDVSATGGANSGTEDAFYASLLKPYKRKNAPFDSLEELHMVRGVSQDFWATFVDPEPLDPRKRVMTVWGQGAVNVNTANAATLLALVCSGAPTAEICTDPAQTQMFLMGITMARGVSMGAPIFGGPNDFVQMMTGKGQIGPLFAALGMKPVKFQSETEFAKTITTESKMFSIYAVGVKKGYRRETRVKVHTVVDFRAAPALGATTGSGVPGTVPTSGTSPTTAPSGTTAGLTTDGFAAAVRPATGGQTVHFRVE